MRNRTNYFTELIQSSELLCSLMFEDAKGCPYNSFTPRSIAVLSCSSSLLAIVSLLAGM